MLSQLLTQTALVTRRLPSSVVDDYGNEVPDEETYESPCLLQQGAGSAGRAGSSRTEPDAAGEMAAGRWLLYLPAGLTITTADTVQVDGLVYEVTGDPEHVFNPRLRTDSHIEVTLERTAGAENRS